MDDFSTGTNLSIITKYYNGTLKSPSWFLKRGEIMDKHYQMQLSIQDLKQAAKIMRRAADRIEQMNQTESFTLNTLISEVEELADRLDAKD